MKSIFVSFVLLYLLKVNLHVQGRLNAPVISAATTTKRNLQQMDDREKKFLKKEALRVIEKDGKDPELLKLTGMSKLDLWLSGIIDNAKKIDKEKDKLAKENLLTP